MLLNDLYELHKVDVDAESPGHIAIFGLNAAHDIFGGHFPGSPILPGVCHMQMVVDAVSAITGRDLRVHEGTDLKFTAVVDPRQGTELEVKVQTETLEDGTVKVISSTWFNGDVCFKFKGLLKE